MLKTTLTIFAIVVLQILDFQLKAQVLPFSPKQSIILPSKWKFKYLTSLDLKADTAFYKPNVDITSWSSINVPGCWEMQGFAEPQYGGDLKAGIGLYRTTFTPSTDWSTNPIFIAFEGVAYGFDFWINGEYGGSFASAYNRKVFDVSKLIKQGVTNVLAVKVSTRPKGWEFDTNDDWSLSGIFRDVVLFSLPKIHIQDFTIKTHIPNQHQAIVSISTLLSASDKYKDDNTIQVKARILDHNEIKVTDVILDKQLEDSLLFFKQVTIINPKLWNAENPYLYTLELSILKGNAVIQKQRSSLGIREVTIDNRIVKLNGKPIKLRGVNHHDLSPVNGRAITRSEILQDLILIKKMNANFIRTSHYPPSKVLVDLCDSMGIYLDLEVPFGYGDKHLQDTSYLSILKQRAYATVMRDKNAPSVLIWSIGNENPLTPITMETGRYVKSLDDTRPYCFPQMGSYFSQVKNDFPDKNVPIYAPHYPSAERIKEFQTNFDKPFLITEYAHNFGNEFDRSETLSEEIYKNPAIVGGAVWHFFEQGLKRKASKPVDKKSFTPYMWTDSITFFDSYTDKGTDGLVFANRVPQADYWQMQKVFSPVKLLSSSIDMLPDQMRILLTLENRYDFTNLADLRMEWMVYNDFSLLEKGTKKVYCNPHDSITENIQLQSKPSPNALFYILKLRFFDKQNQLVYEKVLQKKSVHAAAIIQQLEVAVAKSNPCQFTITPSSIAIKSFEKKSLELKGPYLRMGRKFTLSNWIMTDNTSSDSINISTDRAWFPHYITNPVMLQEEQNGSTKQYLLRYERSNTNQSIEGNVTYTTLDEGALAVSYSFTPKNINGVLFESGLSFLLPFDYSEFRWIGQGPYPTYPGKSLLAEFGQYHLNSEDLNFNGNRSNVSIASVTDKKGNGFILLLNDANLAVEKVNNGLLISHNALLSGRYSKKSLPDVHYKAEKVKEIRGSFKLIPLNQHWPIQLRKLLGHPNGVVTPFKPFYYTYDE